MTKQAMVIGLGQFGMSLANALAQRGMEVLAVDTREERVRAASEFELEAVCFDATETAALARASPELREVCVCAIGDESKESSIICTALLRQMGARRVVARANDELHARILRLVGAHEVVNPEQEFGERFASRILYERVVGELTLGSDLLITELTPPAGLVGRALAELQLPHRFGVMVVAIRGAAGGEVILPSPAHVMDEKDVLIVVSKPGAIGRLLEQS